MLLLRFLLPIMFLLVASSVPCAPLAAPVSEEHTTIALPALSDITSFPRLLSRTGAFNDIRTLAPAPGLNSYELNVPFWSDGAAKRRWVALPGTGEKIGFRPTGEWAFPAGTVFIKHFAMPRHPDETTASADLTVSAGSSAATPIETRLLVRDVRGGIYGATYRWRSDGSDADLVTEPTRAALQLPTTTTTGTFTRTQIWHFPGPNECRLCHTPQTGGVLGLSARQLNRDVTFSAPAAPPENQLLLWSRLGLFDRLVTSGEVARLPHLSPPTDSAATLDHRARSWLDVNCAMCHRPGGVASQFDARFDTSAAAQNIIDGPVLINLGLDHARVIAPNDPWRSVALIRVSTLDGLKMPPVAHETIDPHGSDLLRRWVLSLPAPPVLPPPRISPPGADFTTTAVVTLQHDDPEAVLRYTLDGSSPGSTSPIYQHPLELAAPTTLRARAYKPGATRSIAAQETFIIR